MRKLSRLLVLPFLALSLPVLAASGVKDNAGMFSSNAVMEADATIAQIKSKFKDDLLIETFSEVPVQLRANLTDANRNQVYQEWARGRARENQVDGVYVLLTKNPGRLQVEVGNNTAQREFTTADRDALTRRMLEGLRANQPDQALLGGVKFVHDTYAANLGSGTGSRTAAGAASGAAGAGAARTGAPTQQPAAKRTGGFGLFSGSCFTWLIIGAVLFFVFRLFANRAARNAGYGGGAGGYGPGRYGQQGQPGYGQPGYGQPGYGQGGFPMQGNTGGGFGRGLMGGLLGGMAGGYLWDRMSGQGNQNSAWGSQTPDAGGGSAEAPPDTDYSGGGADFGGGDSGGGDFGGGGDSGGGGGDF